MFGFHPNERYVHAIFKHQSPAVRQKESSNMSLSGISNARPLPPERAMKKQTPVRFSSLSSNLAAFSGSTTKAITDDAGWVTYFTKSFQAIFDVLMAPFYWLFHLFFPNSTEAKTQESASPDALKEKPTPLQSSEKEHVSEARKHPLSTDETHSTDFQEKPIKSKKERIDPSQQRKTRLEQQGKRLFRAIRSRDSRHVKAVLGEIPESDRTEVIMTAKVDSTSLLHEAARHRQSDIMQILLNAVPQAERGPIAKKAQSLIQRAQNSSTYSDTIRQIGLPIQYKPTVTELKEMVTAIQGGDNSTVKKLLLKGFNPNQILDERDATPLFEAADKEQLEIVNTLLQHKADPNFAHSDFGSPLIRAVMTGNKDIIQILLAKGAKVNASHKMIGTLNSALDWAAYRGNPEVFQLLLDHGADPEVATYNEDIRFGCRSNPLMTAVDSEHPEIIRKLSTYHPHIELINYALRRASIESTPEVVQALAEHCIPDERVRQANLQFVFRRSSCSTNFPRLLKSEYLRQAWGEDYMLGWTLDYDKVNNLQLLLEMGLNPNHQFSSGKKPLDEAQSYKAATLLLQYGATTEHEATKWRLNEFLKAACNAQDVKNAKILLEHGAQHPDDRRGGNQEPADTDAYKNYRKVVMAIFKQSVQRNGGIAHPFGHLFPITKKASS